MKSIDIFFCLLFECIVHIHTDYNRQAHIFSICSSTSQKRATVFVLKCMLKCIEKGVRVCVLCCLSLAICLRFYLHRNSFFVYIFAQHQEEEEKALEKTLSSAVFIICLLVFLVVLLLLFLNIDFLTYLPVVGLLCKVKLLSKQGANKCVALRTKITNWTRRKKRKQNLEKLEEELLERVLCAIIWKGSKLGIRQIKYNNIMRWTRSKNCPSNSVGVCSKTLWSAFAEKNESVQ